MRDGDGFEAHHLIPVSTLKQSDTGVVLIKAARAGFHFNGAMNGRKMPSGHGWGEDSPTHQRYTADVIAEIRNRRRQGLIVDDASARRQMEEVAVTFKRKIDNGEYWPLPLP